MPIKWHDYIPDAETTTSQSELEPARPRTVAQQARSLGAYPPVVIDNAGSRCQLCARSKAVVATRTIWRHSLYACEDCLRSLLAVLEQHNT